MSENIEMYLISIARITESTHDETVPIPKLAEKLNILPVSTNQMIRKLEETGLVIYLPYKGVQLTDEGRKIARQIQRHHDLWEIFLIDYLKFPNEAADSVACRLEHILSNDEIEHLSDFLGNPSLTVNGSPLQPPSDNPARIPEFTLSRLNVNQCAYVSRLNVDQAVISFLTSSGIRPGIRLTAIARGDSGEVLVLVEEGSRAHLSAQVAEQIWLRRD